MRDKLKDWFAGRGALSDAGAAVVPVNVAGDAEGALIALGYKPQEASRMVAAVNDDRWYGQRGVDPPRPEGGGESVRPMP